MITKEGSTKILNFMTPGAGILALGCGHISLIVKMHYSLKNLFLYIPAWIRHTIKVYSDDDNGRVNPNYKFYDPRWLQNCSSPKKFC